MSNYHAKILGSGAYLPGNPIFSEELEKELGFPEGTIEKKSGVLRRFRAHGETSSEMGAKAAVAALAKANLRPEEIDVVVAVGGVPQQAIPSTAALIHRHLQLKNIPAFDINATCLSFLVGLFHLSHMIDQGIYRYVLLVSSDIASVGLNPKDPKTASLFGDGAAAYVLGPSDRAGLLASHFETRSELGEDCECIGGGSRHPFTDGLEKEELYFRMNGPRLFKTALYPLLSIVEQIESTSNSPVDFYIPHQASPFALDLLRKKMGVEESKFMSIVRDYGNMIAASIPFALHMAIEEEKIQRGDHVLLFGTAAGLTLGGVLIEY